LELGKGEDGHEGGDGELDEIGEAVEGEVREVGDGEGGEEVQVELRVKKHVFGKEGGEHGGGGVVDGDALNKLRQVEGEEGKEEVGDGGVELAAEGGGVCCGIRMGGLLGGVLEELCKGGAEVD
jgi:hypothetical protein